MSETFDHPDDHTPSDDGGHVDSHDHGEVHEPLLPQPDVPAPHEPLADLPGHPDAAESAPAIAGPGPAGEESWHADPAADEDLRAWLDAAAPALDPPAEFDARLADDLTAEASRDGKGIDALVREVLDRLGRS